jgi:hypothetical protein
MRKKFGIAIVMALAIILAGCNIADPEQWITDNQQIFKPFQNGYDENWPCGDVPCECPTGVTLAQDEIEWRWRIIDGRGEWEYSTPCTDEWFRTDR